MLIIVASSAQSGIHAAALPERIAVQFTNENGKIIPRDTLLLNRAQFGVLQEKSIIVQDFSGFDRNHIPLPKSNVTPQALRHIISLFTNASNEEQVGAAVNNMKPKNLIPLVQAANFLGIARLKAVALSDDTLTKLGDYVAGHPHELDRLTVLADDTAFCSVFNRLRDMFATRHTLTGHGSAVNSVAWSRDGTSLASGSCDKSIRIWNADSGKLLRTLNGHTHWVKSIALSPDGTSLASGSDDKSIRIWNAYTGKLLHTLSHTHWVRSVALSPDGTSLASEAGDGSICIWNAIAGKLLRILNGHTGSVKSVAFGRGGTILASGSYDESIRIWNTESGKLLHTLNGHTNCVNSVAFSHDGTYLASGSDDKSICIWNAENGELLRTLNGHTDWVTSVAWHPNGTYLASGSDDRSIRIWNACTGEPLRTLNGHTNWVNSVALSPDGISLASGSYDSSIRIWNIALLNYDNTKLSAAEVVIAWFILNTDDPNKITSAILKLVPQDLLSILVDTARPNIAQKIQSLGFPQIEEKDETN